MCDANRLRPALSSTKLFGFSQTATAKKETTNEEYEDALAAAKELQPPTLRELAIIIRIELKLTDYCAGYFKANNIEVADAKVDFFLPLFLLLSSIHQCV